MTPREVPDNVADLAARRLDEHGEQERLALDAYMDEVDAGAFSKPRPKRKPKAAAADPQAGQTLADKLRGRLITGPALANIRPSPPLVEGVLYKGTSAMLVGPPKCGKTFLVVDLVGAVLTGRDWQGFPTDPDPTRPVVILAGEGLPEVPRRLTAWAQHYGYDPADILDRVVVLPGGLPLQEAEYRGALVEVLGELSPQLVVVDTLARHLVGGEENSGRDIGQFTATVDRVAETTGALVLTVHHVGKDPTRGGRGHSSLLGNPYTELVAKGESPNLQVVNTAQRSAAEAAPWWCELVPAGTDPETGGPMSLVAKVRSGGAVLDPSRSVPLLELLAQLGGKPDGAGVTGGVWQRAAAEELGIQESPFYKAVAKLREAGAVSQPTPRGRYWLPQEDDPPDDF